MTTPQQPPPGSRLLAASGPSLTEHHARFGQIPCPTPSLIESIDRAGLTGRGGAGFPTGRKMAAVTGRQPVVVANGAEGEPLSRKDAFLLAHSPHLVLDGLDAAAAAVGAETVYLYVSSHIVSAVEEALDEREVAGLDRHRITVVEAPETFLSGEESALSRRIEGGPALPRDRKVITAVSGVGRRPTLVNNVETLAHIALIARFGPRWFKSVGDKADPGSMLVTLSGELNKCGVVEISTGSLLSDVIRCSGATEPRSVRAALVGGYHGTWIPTAEFDGASLSRADRGAGIVYALPPDRCGLRCIAYIAGYLAEQSARQCGPCLNGLPRLARLLDDLAHTRGGDALLKDVYRITRLVDGRGSCRHPDGAARMVRSAMRAFATDIEHHRHGRCEAAAVATSTI